MRPINRISLCVRNAAGGNDTYARAATVKLHMHDPMPLRINPRFYLSSRVPNRNLFALGESPPPGTGRIQHENIDLLLVS